MPGSLKLRGGILVNNRAKMESSTIKAAGLILVLLMYGCYETDFPVLDTGERLPAVGKYECVNRISGQKEAHTFTEETAGAIFASYRYRDSDGSTLVVKKLPSGLFLGQTPKKGGGFAYAFMDILDEQTHLVLMPDMLGKSDYIEALLKKY